MPTSYTSLLGFALPVTGELQGTWGTTVNDSITELVEDAIAATATASVTSGNWTLSTTGSGSANEARCAILVPTGTPGVSRNIVAPSQSKAYIVINQSDASVVLKGSATTGVTITAGDKALCAWDGTDFVRVGASAGGSNTQVQFNSNGNLAGSANLTFNGTTLTAAAFSGPLNGTVGATTPNTVVATQVDITAQGDLRLQDSAGGEYVAIQAPATLSSSYTLTMPTTDGDANQVLTTDGSGGLSWSTLSSGAAISNDTGTTSNLFPLFANATTGTPTTIFTSNAKLLYKPSTGELQASELVASNGLIVNSTTISASYTVATGTNAMSVGPITIASGQTVTVSSGQRWVVI